MRAFALLLIPLLLACSGVLDDPSTAGDDTSGADEPSAVDILLVVDPSGSMATESSAVLLGLEAALDGLDGLEWQIAITTTSADPSRGRTSGVDPGEAGTLTAGVVAFGDDDRLERLRAALACDTIYWRDADLRSDPGYAGSPGDCPLPEDGEVVEQYLQCLCPTGWVDDEGAGNEEGLEAALDTLCRAAGDPPGGCWDETAPISGEDGHSVAGFLRDDTDTLVVILSDEGDGSRRAPTGTADADAYVSTLAEFATPVRVSVLGPAYHDQDGTCLDGAQTWGVERYQQAADATGGLYVELTDPADACAPSDVAAGLRAIFEDASD